MNKITLDDLKSYQEDMIAEEKEAAKRAENNECVCGTIDCATEYSCYTSGY